jgi:prevent-host-death family protein
MACTRAWVRVPLAPLKILLWRGRVEVGAHEFRNRFGWYMERAAAGEEFLVTRRGKPYVRLVPVRSD